jgi:hypothetical protein
VISLFSVTLPLKTGDPTMLLTTLFAINPYVINYVAESFYPISGIDFGNLCNLYEI